MRIIWVSFILIVLDQASKIIVKSKMLYGESINILGDFLKFTFVENPGMAFGLDFGPTSKFFLSLFSIIASLGLIYYLYKIRKEKVLYRLSIALIFAGAVGNLIDRVFYGIIYGDGPLMYGKVVDFINVEFFDFTLFGHTFSRWPIFNVADASVTIGVILLLLFSPKTETQKDSGSEIMAVEGINNEAEITELNEKTGDLNDKNDNREEVRYTNS